MKFLEHSKNAFAEMRLKADTIVFDRDMAVVFIR